MNKLSEMHFFVTIINAGSISEAAARIGTAKSVASRRLQQLETRLGITLIERGRGIRLTHAGEIFYERCVKIISDVMEAEAAVQNYTSSLNGRLRIAVPVSFGYRYLTSLLAQFSQRYPQLNMDIEYVSHITNIHNEGYDAAVVTSFPDDSSFISRKITGNRNVICASPDYLSTYGEPISPQDLAHHQSLLYTPREPHGVWSLSVNGVLKTFRVRGHFRTNNLYQLMESTISGMGIAIIPVYLAVDAIVAGKLKIVMPEYTPEGGDIAIIYGKAMRASPKIDILENFLRERFKNTPEWEEKMKLFSK